MHLFAVHFFYKSPVIHMNFTLTKFIKKVIRLYLVPTIECFICQIGGILSRESVIVLNGAGQARESGKENICTEPSFLFLTHCFFVPDRHNLSLYKISKYTELYSPEVAIWLLMFCCKNFLHFGAKRQNRPEN